MGVSAEEEVVDQLLPRTQQDDSFIALRKAVDETLELRRVISSFRDRCFRCREAGFLPNVVESWYVQLFVPNFQLDTYPMSLVDRNPYAKFKAQNPNPNLAALYSKLDFLLDEIPVNEARRHFDFEEGEDDVPTNELLLPLSTEAKLGSLIQPSPYLRHDENVALAVLDIRLWLNHSPLPVVLGRQESYADLRTQSVTLVRRDDKPSTFHTLLRQFAVFKYWSKKDWPALNLYHPGPEDFSEQDSYWARLSRVRYPHQDLQSMSASKFAAELSKFAADEEDAESLLEDWETSETRSIYRVLAEHIFDKAVE